MRRSGAVAAAGMALCLLVAGTVPAGAGIARTEGESSACTGGTVVGGQVTPAYSGGAYQQSLNGGTVTCTVVVPAGEEASKVRLGTGQSATDSQRSVTIAVDGGTAQQTTGPAAGTITLWVAEWFGTFGPGTHTVVLGATNGMSVKVDYVEVTSAAVPVTTTTVPPATTTTVPPTTTTTVPPATTTTVPPATTTTTAPPASVEGRLSCSGEVAGTAEAYECSVAQDVTVGRAEMVTAAGLALFLLAFMAAGRPR